MADTTYNFKKRTSLEAVATEEEEAVLPQSPKLRSDDDISVSLQHLLPADPTVVLRHNQSQSAAKSIDDLPTEMRNQIYENVAMVIREDTTNWVLCLLSANHQTIREAGPIILRCKAFSFAITTSPSVTEGGSCDSLRRRLASITNVVANSACRIAVYLEDLTDISIFSLALVILTIVRSARTLDIGRFRLTMKEAAMDKHAPIGLGGSGCFGRHRDDFVDQAGFRNIPCVSDAKSCYSLEMHVVQYKHQWIVINGSSIPSSSLKSPSAMISDAGMLVYAAVTPTPRRHEEQGCTPHKARKSAHAIPPKQPFYRPATCFV